MMPVKKKSELPEFKGGVNAVLAASNELPEYRGGANFVLAASNDLPEYVGGVNGAEAAVHELPEFMGETKPVLATANDKLSLGKDVTYQAPAVKQTGLQGSVGCHLFPRELHQHRPQRVQQSIDLTSQPPWTRFQHR